MSTVQRGRWSVDGRASIAFGTVYLDANTNGRFDAGERYVPTDLAGKFKFTNLPAGTYSVAVALDDGFVRTSASARTISLATATAAPMTLQSAACIFSLSSLRGRRGPGRGGALSL